MNEEPQSAPSLFGRILLATTLLSAARTALIALKDPYLGDGLWYLGARSAARHFIEGGALCAGPAILFLLLATRNGWPRLVALTAAAVAGYLFVSFRLPSRPFYAPQYEGTKAFAAHGGAALSALAGAAVLAARSRFALQGTVTALTLLTAWLPATVLRLWPGASAPERPNLLLISIDTLRADRLGCYGYDEPTSPELDQFAQDAYLYRNAYSPESWTLPAHMSMLTSLYPTSHGVAEETSLSRKIPTLATQLSDGGYATFGIVDVAYWMGPKFGFARGFDSYHVMPNYAEAKIDSLLGLIDDLNQRPFFAFLHLYDVHSDKKDLPYEADPEDIERFAGWYEGDFTGCNERGECASELLLGLVGRREELPPDDAAYVSSLYDAGIRTLDRKLGRLFESLGERELLENTAVLITADHGEEFFEHGRPAHTQYYDECVRIPFILRPPGGVLGGALRGAPQATTPRIRSEMASLVDVLPTMLEFAGLEPETAQGISLLPLLRGESPPTEREVVLIDGRLPALGLRTERWSIVPTKTGIAAFDRRSDPAETRDLFQEESELRALQRLRERLESEAKRLETTRDHFGPGETQPASSSDLKSLRALGYGGD